MKHIVTEVGIIALTLILLSHISCLKSVRNQIEDDILKSDQRTEWRVYTRINSSSVQVPGTNTPGLTSPPYLSNKGGQEEAVVGEGRTGKDLEATSLPSLQAILPGGKDMEATSLPSLQTILPGGKDMELRVFPVYRLSFLKGRNWRLPNLPVH